MAKYQITGPDGKSFEVTAPDSATQADVMKYAQSQMQAKPAEMVKPDKPTALERVGRGTADVTEGLKQIYLRGKDAVTGGNEGDAYTKQKTEEIARYDAGRGDGVDWWRLGGDVLATLPAMAATRGTVSLPLRAVQSGAQGGAVSGLMFTPEGGSKAGQVAMGAAFGTAIPYGFEALRKVISPVISKFTSAAATPAALEAHITAELRGKGVDPANVSRQVMDQLVTDAQQALKTGGEVSPEMLARKADILAVDGQPFKAALSRNPRDWQQFQNTASIPGVGDKLVVLKEQNALALTDALRRVSQGGKTAYEVGESVFETVGRKENEMQRAVGQLYRKADEEFGKAMTSQPTNLLKAAEDLSIRADADPIITTIKRYMTKRGIMDAEGAVKPEGYLSLKESEELRKLIRDVSWNKDRSVRDIGSKLINALDDDVFSAFPQGSPFLAARQAAKAKFDEFSSRSLQGIMEGKVAPERIVDKMVFTKGGIDELRSLQKVLTTGSKEQIERGDAVMADIKGAVIDKLLMKATGATSADEVAGRAFSGRNFAKALEGIDWQKLNLIFTPKEAETLRQIQRASKALTEEVPYSDVNYSRTGAVIADLINKLSKTPLAGDVVMALKGDVRGALNPSAVVQKPLTPLPQGRVSAMLPGAAGATLQNQGQ